MGSGWKACSFPSPQQVHGKMLFSYRPQGPGMKINASRHKKLFGILLAATLLHSAAPLPLQAQVTDLTQDAEVERKRQINTLQDRIRLLSGEGKYGEVLVQVDALLAIDPENKTAQLYKDIAERQIASRGSASALPSTGLETSPSGTSGAAPDPFGPAGVGPAQSAPADGTTPQAAAPAAPAAPSSAYVPPPLEERQSKRGGMSLRPILIGVAVAVGVGLLVLAVVWLLGRRRAKAAPASTMNSMRGGMNDRPTVHGEVTRQHTEARSERQAPMFDAPTAPENAEVQAPVALATPSSRRNAPDFSKKAAPKPAAAPAPAASKVEPDKPTLPEEPESDSFSLGNLVVAAPVIAAPEVGTSMSIDYSDTDSPLARSQASDIYQTAGGAFAGTPEEVIGTPRKPAAAAPPAPAPPMAASAPAAKAAQPDPKSEVINLGTGAETLPAAKPLPTTKLTPAQPAASAKPAPLPLDLSAPLAGETLDAPPALAPPPAIDANALTFNSLMFTGGESAPSAPPPAPAAPAPQDADALTFNSLMFGGGLAPAAPSAPPAAPAAAESKPQEGDLTFNSLMFGGPTAPAVPNAPAPAAASAPAGDDLTLNSFNQQFSNVMFGSDADKTAVPGAATAKPAAAAAAASAEPTRKLTSVSPAPTPAPAPTAESADSGDRTMQLPAMDTKPSAAPAKAGSMFERQRDAGRKAMEEQDFAKAVQCFSVAASLKPADKEIRELLEEARRLRRG
jgi:hypothetical protein